MNDKRMKKMESLKRKSRRNNLVKELNFVTLTKEPFLDIEDNNLYCEKVFSVLNTKKNKIKLQGDDYRENIKKSTQLLKETIENINETTKEGRLLFFRENEIEAVLISVSEVFSNLDKALKLTKFSAGYGDFILVAEDFHFGLCIERTEYYYEFSVWGLS